MEGEEGVEVAGRGTGERLGMLDVLEALFVDPFQDGRYFSFEFGCVFDSRRESVIGKRREGIVEDERIWVFFPGAALEAKKVAKEGVATLGENTLRVILNSFEDKLAVTNAHDDTAFFCDAGDHEVFGKGFHGGTQGVVASRTDALRDAFEATSTVVSNGTEFAVFDFACISVVASAHPCLM